MIAPTSWSMVVRAANDDDDERLTPGKQIYDHMGLLSAAEKAA